MNRRLIGFFPVAAGVMALAGAGFTRTHTLRSGDLLLPAQLHSLRGCSRFGQPGLGISATPHLNYYGGKVISNVKIIMVMYGSGTYGSFLTSSALPNMQSFYTQMVNSPYIDVLSEYNTPTQTIGRGSFIGTIQITPAASRNGSTITDTNIQSEISAQIASGILPAPDQNTLYMVHFPAGKSINQGGSSSCVAGGFCAYHSTAFDGSGREYYYGVLPDMSPGTSCSTGCGGSTWFNNQCSVASHETIEAITDAEVGIATTFAPPLAWYDPINTENGDICNANQSTFVGTDGFTYTVQKGWSNLENACVASRSAVANVTAQSQVTRGSIKFTSRTGRYSQTVIVKNVGVAAFGSPLSLVLDNLGSGVALYNKTGITAATTPVGSPYYNSTVALGVGSSVNITLQFTAPSAAAITYNTRVLAGAGAR